jgi:hypothetical protein
VAIRLVAEDGKTDVAIWRSVEANWYVINSRTNTLRVQQMGRSRRYARAVKRGTLKSGYPGLTWRPLKVEAQVQAPSAPPEQVVDDRPATGIDAHDLAADSSSTQFSGA